MENLVYIGFWKRFMAMILDCSLCIPLILFLYPLQIRFSFHSQTILPYCLAYILQYIFLIFFFVKWGGTPGLLMMQMRTINNKFHYPSFFQAIGQFTFAIISSILYLAAIHHIMKTFPESILIDEPKAFTSFIKDHSPIPLYNLALNLTVWLLAADWIVILFSKKKRTLHDYFAGTYLVTKQSYEVFLEKNQLLNEPPIEK